MELNSGFESDKHTLSLVQSHPHYTVINWFPLWFCIPHWPWCLFIADTNIFL